MLGLLDDDILDLVGAMLSTRNLAALAQVITVRDQTWTTHVRRRCGTYWIPGKAGLRRLYDAVYTPVPSCHSNVQGVSIACNSAFILRNGSLWAPAPLPGRLLAHGSNVNPMRCIAAIDQETVAVGHDYGIYLCTSNSVNPIWLEVSVKSIAYVNDDSLWVCTPQGQSYRYDMQTAKITALARYTFCVSGPVGMVGCHIGTWPVKSSLAVQVTEIAQSRVVLAAWHVNGYVSIFSTGTLAQLHLVCTGPQLGRPLSVVGDVVRVGGAAYVDGCIHGSCPCDQRVTTRDGRYMCALTIHGVLGVLGA